MCMIKQLTGAVGGGGNPFAPSPGGGAMVAQTGYKASFLGQDIVFADEAQYLKVKYAYEQKIGKGGGGIFVVGQQRGRQRRRGAWDDGAGHAYRRSVPQRAKLADED
jgi:hypothetical protein